MKQTERASVMRVLVDMIEADGIIDARELVSLDKLRSKYGITHDDEVSAASCTFSDALQVLSATDANVRHGLLADMEEVSMSDAFCAREEALLILALRCGLTVGMSDRVSFFSVDKASINVENTQILYLESEYDDGVNGQIQQHFRAICAEVRLAGFDFVYLPKIVEHYRSISEADIIQIAEFLYPKVGHTRLVMIIRQLLGLTTASFCKDQMAAKLNLRQLETAPPSLLVNVGESVVNDQAYSNYMAVELADDVMQDVRGLLDMFAEHYRNYRLNYLQEERGRFIFRGFYRQIFDILMLRKGVKSSVVVDPAREAIVFPEAGVKLDKVHRKEKALYALFLMESASGGINFTKPKPGTPRQMERYERRMDQLMRKYSIIYRKFGGDIAKTPDIRIYEKRAPMLSLLKKQITLLGDVLYNVDDYVVQRNFYGNYAVKIPPALCYCADRSGDGITLLSEDDEWKNISAL